ncbi:hypothetical protein Glove_311g22 [Diversispora epigaea]|uniref:Uncharacterized protein n=1 Tax=Diversispora epigaea TaxID=1348612 RepID=A0A397HW17_9GLOM|nr:hypothetical protein Glove_311g22 [Diversispora epigaea]
MIWETRKDVSTLADLVNEMDTDQLIEFLWNKHLDLSRKNLNILKDQKVAGSGFFTFDREKTSRATIRASSRIENVRLFKIIK